MKKTQLLTRALGHQLRFPSRTVSDLIKAKDQIINAIDNHGCICIKNVDFQEKEIIEFTKGIWDEIIKLPKFLCFNNQHETYQEVARVGNVQLDGTLKDSQKEAAYWHQDGNFWGQEKKHIYNALHTREEPHRGGETHVMDLVQAAKFLRESKPKLYARLKTLVGLLKIEQINDFKLYNAKNILNIESITRHTLVTHCPKTGQERLFLSVQKLADAQTLQQTTDITIQQVIKTIQDQMGFYAHKWEKGDLLIWDNLQVMHRSSGSFEGRRLLFRTQGRFN